jgi:tetratricopeptide (TPR) repeat protein
LDLEKEVAGIVSDGLKVVIAGEEKEQIESIPTENTAAYNAFMLGSYYLNISIYSPDRKSSNQAIYNARRFFKQAIELDSSFSDAYASLGSVYINNLYYLTRDPDKARNHLETGCSFLEKALFYNEGNLEALRGKAAYFDKIGLNEDADAIWERISEYTEPAFDYFQQKAQRYSEIQDYYSAIESYRNYLQLKPAKSIQPPHLLRSMIWIFRETGYYELEKALVDQLLAFTRDSIEYFENMMSSEIFQADFSTALSYAHEARRLDSTRSYSNWMVGLCYLWLNDWSNALHYIAVSEDLSRQSGSAIRPQFLSGYAYHMNGYEKDAEYHFKGAIKRLQKQIEHAAPFAQQYGSQFYLANIYLVLGDKNKALEYLKIMDSSGVIDYGWINILLNWTGLNDLRSNPEYQELLANLEDKYQKQYKLIGNLTKDLKLN